jgi:hypothetical protein
MRPLPIACCLALATCASCGATSASQAASERGAMFAPTARDLEALPPEFLPAFTELQRSVAAGDDLTARRILMSIYSRAPQGRALSLAQAFERVLAGRAAVAELHLKLVARPDSDSGKPPRATGYASAESNANAPSNASSPAHAGAPADASAAGDALAPSAAATPSPATTSSPAATPSPATTPSNATPSAAAGGSSIAPSGDGGGEPGPRVVARLLLVAENSADVAMELKPGPATLTTTKTSVAPVPAVHIAGASAGSQEERSETHPFTEIKSLRVDPGGSVEVELARFFIDVPDNLLAVRLSFELELRSGVIVRDGRELPAMNVGVRGDEVTCWIHLRHPEWKATPESLEEFAVGVGTAAGDCALEIAVRMPAAERSRALDRLAAREHDISRTRLEELVPALRWLADDSTMGGDPDLWRAFLRARTAAKPRERPVLELPEPAPR